MIIFIILSTFTTTVYSSFCGDSAIPYSFEVLSNGQPILGCARPTCFGWSTSGLPASHNASFYRIQKKPDGFLRKERASIPPFEIDDVHYYHPQTAESFGSTSCDQDDQWVGGIAPLLNVSAAPVALQCCRFEPLKLSVDRGIATVAPGQIVVGGEASKKSKQFAFDYISNIFKTIQLDGRVSYEVNIRRFPCLDLPSKAYQAPVSSVETPISLENAIEGPFNEDGSRETIIGSQDQLSAPTQAPDIPPTLTQEPFQNPIQPQEQLQVIEGQVPQPQLISGQVPQVAQPLLVAPPQSALPSPAVPQLQPIPYMIPFNSSVLPNVYSTALRSSATQSTSFIPRQTSAQCCRPYYLQQPYYSPGAYYCFSPDTTVLTIDNVPKRMDELKIGDWIQTIEGNQVVYSQVKLWLHKNPDQLAVFHKISLENGNVLKLTGKHFIFKTKCTANPEVPVEEVVHEAVFAETVQIGDCLYTEYEVSKMRKVKVMKVEKVQEKGIYSPLVSQGRLMVNGILSSCHSVIQSNTLQQTFFGHVDSFFSLTQWLFGSMANDVRDLPLGMELLMSLMDQVLPKNLVTL